MRNHGVALAILPLLTAPAALAQAPCGAPDVPCEIPGGSYHVALPADPATAPVVVWLHGYGGSGSNEVANAGLAGGLTGRGYVMIAPNGQPAFGEGPQLDWGVVDGLPPERDDIAFLRAVLQDAETRFGLDPPAVLATGFSRGGSMIWDLACRAPDSADAFASVSGGFWQPMAETCAAPVHLHHTHGFSDTTVPLEGRAAVFNGVPFAQGNILEGLEVWRRVDGCPGAADVNDTGGGLWLKAWNACAAGSLTLRLGPHGHGVPPGWTDMVLDWFEAAVPAAR